MYDIFISYRREDGKEFARQLQLKLQNLGYRTFLDVEELKDGVFDKRITAAIEASTVFLALLTPRYFCRCAEEEDWVRKEIVCAVEGKKHIVPVNIDRLFKNFPEDCPQIIRDNIGQHQFTEVFTGQQFTTTMEYLDVNRLQPYIVKVEKVQEGAIIHIDADMDCQIEIFGKQICTVQAGADQEIRLLKGTKKIKAISLDNPKDYIEFKFTVPDNDSEELLEIKLQPVKEAREQQEKEKEEKSKRIIEEVEQDGLYDVKLLSSGQDKLNIVKLISQIANLSEEESNNIVQNIPSIAVKNITKRLAIGVKSLLEKAGATAEVIEAGSFTPTKKPQNNTPSTPLYDITLISTGAAKLQVVKAIKEALGIGVKEAKDITDYPPTNIARGVAKEVAEQLKRELEELECQVYVCTHETPKAKQESEIEQQVKNRINTLSQKAYKYYEAKDYSNAIKYYTPAAELGDASSQAMLGYFYHTGTGVEKDIATAVYWYKLAANQGLAAAMFNLGLCYEYGTGVTKNLSEAITLYRKAAEKGQENAKQRLKELEK